MAIDRRNFLLLSGGLLATKGCASAPTPRPDDARIGPPEGSPTAPASAPLTTWEGVRAAFELDPAYVHMAGLLLVSHPRPVRESIDKYRRELDRNPALFVEGPGRKLDRATRTAAADFLGVEYGEVALTESTTTGLGLLYGGFKLRPGQEILTTEHDHYSTHEALRFRSLRDGAPLRKVALYDRGATTSENEVVERLLAALTPKTRVVAVTWVHSSTGVKLPIRAMADALERANKDRDPADRALFCVDGVHGFGVENAQMRDLGCDFFVAGCHKWIFGPRGTGVLWGREHEWDNVHRCMAPFEFEAYIPWLQGQIPSRSPGGVMISPGGFHAFEHRWSLPAALAMHQEIGRSRIQERIHGLNKQLKEGLSTMQHVTLHTPRSERLSSGLTCFEVAGMDPDKVVAALLEKKIIGSTTPYGTSYARLTPGLLNTPEQVDAALDAIRSLA